MGTYTENYRLYKPGYDEAADVGKINDNMDKIDEILNSLDEEKDNNHTYPTQTKGTFTPELWAGTVKLRQRVQWGYYVKIGALCYFSLHVAAWHDGVSGNLILKGFPYPFVVCEISVATRLLTSNRTLWNVLFIAGNTDTSVSTQGAFYNAETGTPISTSQLTDQAISFLQGVYRCE